MDERPVMVDVCSGIGGFGLAGEWAGFRPALFCEIDLYCRRVLAKHWPEVPIAPNIHTLTGEIVREHLAFDYAAVPDAESAGCEAWDGDAEGDKGRRLGRSAACASGAGSVDLLTGGIPCQPFSVAGKQRGKDDPRHLWPEMSRLITELRPTWVCVENVAGFVRMALDDVCLDLETAGYEVQPFVFPACGVGAWHRRERVFIIAHDANADQQGSQGYGRVCHERRGAGEQPVGAACADVPDTDAVRRDVRRSEGQGVHGREQARDEIDSGGWLGWDGRAPLDTIWQSEPPVGRLAHGISRRVDQLRALGNSVSPQQAYPVLAAITEVLR
jgi:DNA (cytosine-5)-methyltransferase 1